MNMVAKKIFFILGLAIVFWVLPNGIGLAGTLHELDISLTDVFQSSVAWGDYDNDGDLDLVLTGYDGTNRYCIIYQNSGSPGYNFTLHQSLTGVSEGSLAWGDYDRDGDLDLLVTGLPGAAVEPVSIVYRNDEGTFINSGESLIGVQYSSVAWGDWDNDGDLDLALAGYNTSVSPFRHLIIYENDSGTFSVGQNLSIADGVQDASLAWADYDNDGDLDLAVAGKKGTGKLVTEIYKNDPVGELSKDASHILTGVGNGSLAWGDYDNDGDLDLALMGSSGQGAILEIYYNDGSPSYVLRVSTSTGLLGVQDGSLAWGDCDNDGDLDLAVNGQDNLENRVAIIYQNDSGTFSEGQNLSTTDGVRYASLAWADYDDDKDLDLVMTGQKSGPAPFSKIYYNDEETPNQIPQPPDTSGFETLYDTSTKRLTIKWLDGQDVGGSSTPVSGLYYNIRIGSESGADDLVAARYGTPLLGNFLSKKKDSKNTRSFQIYAKGYFWSVQTIDTSLGYSWSEESSETSWSEERHFEDPTPPPPPETPTDEGEYTYKTTIRFSWTQNNLDPETAIYNYRLQVRSQEDGKLKFDGNVGDVKNYSVSGCEYNKTYEARVKSQSGYGYSNNWSGWSNGIMVVRFLDISNNLIHPKKAGDNTATIKYFIIKASKVSLKIYNLRGELVRSLFDNENRELGADTESWSGENEEGSTVASGIYIVHIETEGAYASEKICVIK